MEVDFPPTAMSKLNMQNILKAKFSQAEMASTFSVDVVRGPGESKQNNTQKSGFGSETFLYRMLS